MNFNREQIREIDNTIQFLRQARLSGMISRDKAFYILQQIVMILGEYVTDKDLFNIGLQIQKYKKEMNNEKDEREESNTRNN